LGVGPPDPGGGAVGVPRGVCAKFWRLLFRPMLALAEGGGGCGTEVAVVAALAVEGSPTKCTTPLEPWISREAHGGVPAGPPRGGTTIKPPGPGSPVAVG
jgi:hypothetical protein